MPTYRYLAKDISGKIYKGVIEAASEREVRRILKAQKLYIIYVKESSDIWRKLTYKKKVTLPELVVFTSQFSALLRSGIILTDCLTTLAGQTSNLYFKEILIDIRKNVDSGMSLSDSLAKYPNVFPKIFVSLVRTGEITGTLDIMLERLSKYFDDQHELREKIKSAVTYPTIVIIAAVAVVIFLLAFVVPTFQRIFGRMNMELPLPTRILIMLGNFVKSNLIFIFLFFVVIVFLGRMALKNIKIRRWWDEYKLRIPKIGNLWQQVILTRFSSTFHILIASGILITQSIEILDDVVGNLYFSEHLRKMLKGILEGRNISELMDEKVFTPLLKRMVVVGERSGRLDEMLNDFARFSQREVDMQTKRLTSFIEPMLTIFLGGLVFFIAISMYLPMFNMVRLFRR